MDDVVHRLARELAAAIGAGVSEDPKVEHIPRQMPKACVHKHRIIDIGIKRDGGTDQRIGNQTVLIEHEFRRDGGAEKHFEIYPNIHPNSQKGDKGEVSRRVFIAQGNHELFLFIDAWQVDAL